MVSSVIALMLLVHSIQAAVEQADIDIIIQLHNKERSLASAPELKWAEKLATSATKWADTCPDGHSTDDLRSGASENLGWGWPTSNSTDVVQQWIAEKSDVVGDGCAEGKQCGHFKIIVDQKMNSVGCATKTECPSTKAAGQTMMQVWVCHYNSEAGAGNTTSPPRNETTAPSNVTTNTPGNVTTFRPTNVSNLMPSNANTFMPSNVTTNMPSNAKPTNANTFMPSNANTFMPSNVTTYMPSNVNTYMPSNASSGPLSSSPQSSDVQQRSRRPISISDGPSSVSPSMPTTAPAPLVTLPDAAQLQQGRRRPISISDVANAPFLPGVGMPGSAAQRAAMPDDTMPGASDVSPSTGSSPDAMPSAGSPGGTESRNAGSPGAESRSAGYPSVESRTAASAPLSNPSSEIHQTQIFRRKISISDYEYEPPADCEK